MLAIQASSPSHWAYRYRRKATMWWLFVRCGYSFLPTTTNWSDNAPKWATSRIQMPQKPQRVLRLRNLFFINLLWGVSWGKRATRMLGKFISCHYICFAWQGFKCVGGNSAWIILPWMIVRALNIWKMETEIEWKHFEPLPQSSRPWTAAGAATRDASFFPIEGARNKSTLRLSSVSPTRWW